MSTNYIGVYGPSGPLYLLKTNVPSQFWVVNGNWLLDLDKIPIPDLPKYKIVKDNFGAYEYQHGCNLITEMYDEGLPYKVLCSHNVYPFDESLDDTKQSKAQYTHKNLSDAVVGDRIVDFKIISDDSLTQQAKEYLHYFEIDCKEIEINCMKELIQSGFKINLENTNMNTLNTDIVTTETVHKVNGMDVNSVDTNALLNYVVQLEASIKKLSEIETKSKFVNKTIEKQQITLAVVVKHLDDREIVPLFK